jgi:hypothetical protein
LELPVRKINSAGKKKRSFSTTLGYGVEETIITHPNDGTETAPELPKEATGNTAGEATGEVAEEASKEPFLEDNHATTEENSGEIEAETPRTGRLSNEAVPHITHPSGNSHSRDSFHREETTESITSTLVPAQPPSDQKETPKLSISSSVTRRNESVIAKTKKSEKRLRDDSDSSAGREGKDLQEMQAQTDFLVADSQEEEKENDAAFYDQTRKDKAIMTDPVSFSSVPCSSVGVQFNFEHPEVVYEEDGSFLGTDGVRYYMWPVNPNQLYGLSGDVFYHTVMQVFQSLPRVPLSRTGEPYQPPYIFAGDVQGSKIEGSLNLHPHVPRTSHSPSSCGKDCSHLKPKKHKSRKGEKLLPIAKQDLQYETLGLSEARR